MLNISNRSTNIIAIILLVSMFFLAFFSMKQISLTMDELAHIPAGYSYLSQHDYRINPEHPPLAKDISAIPLMFMHLHFPKDCSCWQKDVNAQWTLGNKFIFHSGNDANKIIFWARIPMILLLIFLAWFLFYATKDFFGNEVALLVLTLFAFSPSFLAHGRLVATDIASTLGFVMATYFWIKFLKKPSRKNVIVAGLIFGAAMLMKFTLILFVPFSIIITLVYALLSEDNKWKNIFRYSFLMLLVWIIGAVFVIWPVYYFHLMNYPISKQLSDSRFILSSSPYTSLKALCFWMITKPILRPFSHYFLGLLMDTQRATSGNTVYFLGKVSASGWKYYFPLVYIMKIPLAFQILTLIVIGWFIWMMRKLFSKNFILIIKNWLKNHFIEFSFLTLIFIYWAFAISGNLNIGLRHVMPTFPFIYILVSVGAIEIYKSIKKYQKLKTIFIYSLILLFVWYISSSLIAFPNYLSYFNELVGGSENGYKYVVDSNYDWGQDLNKLVSFVDKNHISKIKVDYFGGSDVKYYLGDRYEQLDPQKGPQKGWLAISATLLQGGRGIPVPGYNSPSGYYDWLNQYKPVARAGNSIFIYHIE